MKLRELCSVDDEVFEQLGLPWPFLIWIMGSLCTSGGDNQFNWIKMSVKSVMLKQLRFIKFKEKERVFFFFLCSLETLLLTGTDCKPWTFQAFLLSAIYSIRFRSEGTVPSNTLSHCLTVVVWAERLLSLSLKLYQLTDSGKKKKKRTGWTKGSTLCWCSYIWDMWTDRYCKSIFSATQQASVRVSQQSCKDNEKSPRFFQPQTTGRTHN